MFKWIQSKIGMLTGHIAGELAANGVLKKVAGDQVSALQASFFHTLSNADEAIFECEKGRLYDKFVTQGATPAQAATMMFEFERYLAGLKSWQAILFRLTVVTETTDDKRLEILSRMFHDTSKEARDRIIQNIVGDEPITHLVCEHVKKNYQVWAIWFLCQITKTAVSIKGVTDQAASTVVRGIKAADAVVEERVAVPLENWAGTAKGAETGWCKRLEKLGKDIEARGGL